MRYPCNYGYIPHTVCGDGDPADVLVILPLPLIPGSVIRCRPVGVLKMSDEAGSDEKILAVPIDKVFAGYSHIDDIGKVSKHWLERIGHFFEHYKDLEKGKWVKLDGWGDVIEAKRIIVESIMRYDAAPDKPHF
jgi:inorganic pyrophosphatase